MAPCTGIRQGTGMAYQEHSHGKHLPTFPQGMTSREQPLPQNSRPDCGAWEHWILVPLLSLATSEDMSKIFLGLRFCIY